MPTRSPAFSTVSPARSWNVTETVNRPYCWASSGAGSTSPVRLGKVLEDKLGRKLPFGTLDINLYRDDWTTMHARPTIGESNITTPLDNKNVILVDDVLFTGARSAPRWKPSSTMAAPRRWNSLSSWIAATANCPIHGDYVGRKINTARSEKVNVLMEERDGRDEVVLESADA